VGYMQSMNSIARHFATDNQDKHLKTGVLLQKRFIGTGTRKSEAAFTISRCP
jgi:hypothetical protein